MDNTNVEELIQLIFSVIPDIEVNTDNSKNTNIMKLQSNIINFNLSNNKYDALDNKINILNEILQEKISKFYTKTHNTSTISKCNFYELLKYFSCVCK